MTSSKVYALMLLTIPALCHGFLLFDRDLLAGGGPVSNDHYVSIDQSNMKVKPGSNVTLNCVGWNGDLAYYIQNRPDWTFKNKDGIATQLTRSFYLTDESEKINANFSDEFKHYGIQHFNRTNSAGQRVIIFALTITENNGGNMLTPVTVLSSLLMVLIGRLVARNL